MTHQIIFHPLADREFREAFNWYEERLEGLGNRFEKNVEEALNLISKNPVLFPKKKANYREAKVNTFPYVIIYKIYSKKKFILISALHHTSKNPRKKYRK